MYKKVYFVLKLKSLNLFKIQFYKFESERILGLRLMECCDTSVLKDNLFTFFPYMFLYLPMCSKHTLSILISRSSINYVHLIESYRSIKKKIFKKIWKRFELALFILPILYSVNIYTLKNIENTSSSMNEMNINNIYIWHRERKVACFIKNKKYRGI